MCDVLMKYEKLQNFRFIAAIEPFAKLGMALANLLPTYPQ